MNTKNNRVEKIYKAYQRNLNSINEYFNKFGAIAQSEDKNASNQVEEMLKQFLLDMGFNPDLPKEEQKNITFDPKAISELTLKIKNQSKLSIHNFTILSNGSFLMLNNYFEYLLSDLLTYYYTKFKESLNEKEFKFTLKELSEFETIDEATNAFVLKEVESMLVELTFQKILEHFDKNLKISTEENYINWDTIIEARERRHLIVHNSSIVNKKYLTRSKNSYDLKQGEKIFIDETYFKKTLQEYQIAGQLLCLNCWGTWDKEYIDKSLKVIVDQSFEYLKEENFESAIKITSYCEKIESRNEVQEDCLMRIRLNKCIAYKKTGNTSLLTKELKKIKVGTASPIFKVVYQILKDEHKGLINNIKKAKILNEIDTEEYERWIIFDFIREDTEMNNQILEVLKKK